MTRLSRKLRIIKQLTYLDKRRKRSKGEQTQPQQKSNFYNEKAGGREKSV